MRNAALVAASVLAIAVAGAVSLSAIYGWTASHEGATAPAAGATGRDRTVLVSTGGEPAPSRPGLVLHAVRIAGGVPRAPTQATVISDKNCAPDSQGISRCTNALRLHSGLILTVRHPHRMMEVPCLEPGEQVKVRKA